MKNNTKEIASNPWANMYFDVVDRSFNINRNFSPNQVPGATYITHIYFKPLHLFAHKGPKFKVMVSTGVGTGDWWHGYAYSRPMIFDALKRTLSFGHGGTVRAVNKAEAIESFTNVIRYLIKQKQLTVGKWADKWRLV